MRWQRTIGLILCLSAPAGILEGGVGAAHEMERLQRWAAEQPESAFVARGGQKRLLAELYRILTLMNFKPHPSVRAGLTRLRSQLSFYCTDEDVKRTLSDRLQEITDLL